MVPIARTLASIAFAWLAIPGKVRAKRAGRWWWSGPERALTRHPCPPWKPGRCVLLLHKHVQVMVPCARERDDPEHLHAPQPQRRRRTLSWLLLAHQPLAAPVDERSAPAQQRRRVLEHHRLGRERTRKHEIVARETLVPVLRPGPNRARVLHVRGGTDPRQELAAAPLALDQAHVRVRQRHRERQAGE